MLVLFIKSIVFTFYNYTLLIKNILLKQILRNLISKGHIKMFYIQLKTRLNKLVTKLQRIK